MAQNDSIQDAQEQEGAVTNPGADSVDTEQAAPPPAPKPSLDITPPPTLGEVTTDTRPVYIRTAFAEAGDRLAIPFRPDGVNSVDYLRGWNPAFSVDPDAGGEYIQRQVVNQLYFTFSKAIQEMQRNGTRDFDPAVIEEGGYNIGEACFIYYNMLTRELVSEPTEGALLMRLKAQSLTNNNIKSPYEEGALYNEWLVDDGVYFGNILIDSINTIPPPGYLMINSADPTRQFDFAVYRRVRAYLENVNVGDRMGLFVKATESTFSIADVRGHFMRAWSNGHTIDAARPFSTSQAAALPNHSHAGITGTNNTGNKAYGGSDKWLSFSGHLNWGGGGKVSNNPIYKDNHADVTPYNFNINIFVKA